MCMCACVCDRKTLLKTRRRNMAAHTCVCEMKIHLKTRKRKMAARGTYSKFSPSPAPCCPAKLSAAFPWHICRSQSRGGTWPSASTMIVQLRNIFSRACGSAQANTKYSRSCAWLSSGKHKTFLAMREKKLSSANCIHAGKTLKLTL